MFCTMSNRVQELIIGVIWFIALPAVVILVGLGVI